MSEVPPVRPALTEASVAELAESAAASAQQFLQELMSGKATLPAGGISLTDLADVLNAKCKRCGTGPRAAPHRGDWFLICDVCAIAGIAPPWAASLLEERFLETQSCPKCRAILEYCPDHILRN